MCSLGSPSITTTLIYFVFIWLLILVIYFVYQIVGVVCNFLGSLSSQQNFAVTDQRYSHRLDQCYISVLQLSFIQKVKENTPLRCESMPTQKTQREERPQTILALLFMFLLFPLGLPYENWASQDCCLFCLRSSFRSSDLPLFYFHGLFFSLLATAILASFSYSKYLKFPPQAIEGPILWE